MINDCHNYFREEMVTLAMFHYLLESREFFKLKDGQLLILVLRLRFGYKHLITRMKIQLEKQTPLQNVHSAPVSITIMLHMLSFCSINAH